MEVRYASQKVQDICTNERQMKRRLDAFVSKKLRLRIAELHNVESFDDLLRGTGRGNGSPPTVLVSGRPGSALTGALS